MVGGREAGASDRALAPCWAAGQGAFYPAKGRLQDGERLEQLDFSQSQGLGWEEPGRFPSAFHSGSGHLLSQGVSSWIQRLRIKARTIGRVNKAIRALNSLFFGGEKHYPVRTVSSLEALPLCQREAIKGIVEKVKEFGKPPPDASSQGALNALRAPASGYCVPEAGVGDVVSMKLDSLSLPSGTIAGVDLAAEFQGHFREMLCDYETWMLQDAGAWSELAEVASQVRPYNDPSLHKRSSYILFLKHLKECGVLGFTDCCRGRVGAFTVAKKPKEVGGVKVERQRLVLDCRQVNLQFKAPPMTELGSLAALTELELGEGESLFTAGADIQDCFYACNMPDGMKQFFCLMSDLSVHECCEVFGGKPADYEGQHRIAPCITVLPMGFSWSFYIVQQLHEQACLRSLGIERTSLVLDGYPAPLLSGGDGGPWAMPYCDNVHCLDTNQKACNDGKNKICNHLRDMGFSLHEEEDAAVYFKTLGGVILGDKGIISTLPARSWSLILAFEFLCRHVVSTDLVQRLLGHAMVVCVLNRCGMAVFRRLYDFVQAGGEPRRLNACEREKSVRRLQGWFRCSMGIFEDVGQRLSPQQMPPQPVLASARLSYSNQMSRKLGGGTSAGASSGCRRKSGGRGSELQDSAHTVT